MGKRGPQKTPTRVLAKRGSPKAAARMKAGEATPPEGFSECPDWVLGEARGHWYSILPMLEGMGVMSPAYSPALAMLVNSLGRYIEYEGRVSQTGPVSVTDNGNEIVSPWWAARNKAWEQAMKAIREFGLSPASTAGVTKIDKNKDGHGIAGLINPKLVG